MSNLLFAYVASCMAGRAARKADSKPKRGRHSKVTRPGVGKQAVSEFGAPVERQEMAGIERSLPLGDRE